MSSMEDVVQIHDQFYILTTSSRVDDRTRVLKHDDTFAVFDRFGDIAQVGMGELGLYHEGTRFLSRFHMRLAGHRPLLLSSTVREDNAVLSVDLTNPDLELAGDLALSRGIVHLERELLLWDGVCHERVRITHYGRSPFTAELAMFFDADFRDIFEVRGARRERTGERLPAECEPGAITFRYRGLDGVERRTRIRVNGTPDETAADRFVFRQRLDPGASVALELSVACESGGERRRDVAFERVAAASSSALRIARAGACTIGTSNDEFDEWIERSRSDLHMMITAMPSGPFPYAGVPWYSVPFGRDAIVTALETLWMEPELGRGVLAYLAETQADQDDRFRDAEPGKILHETRRGEMAALGEIPFARYYGSVDATPLFVMLAGAWFRSTGDRAAARALWPHVERALTWMEGAGDPDGDGWIEYRRRSEHGLAHQGWRDSHDAVYHADGRDAEPPIALCEVQGYAYAALRAAATLARALGDRRRAAVWRARAAQLRVRFDETFWCDALGTYAMALDGAKEACRIRSSAAGHCLYAGIVLPDRVRRLEETLMSAASWSGWGVRTVASGEARYNPMSYHNGSVWPHDNAIVGAGLARYGRKEAAAHILTSLFEASHTMDQGRLPELFCGFDRRSGEGPTLYPVACSPQAWAACAPFLLLQACLGLVVDGTRGRVSFRRPVLPEGISEVTIRRLRVGEGAADVLLRRHERGVGVNVLHRDGPVDVVVVA